MKLLLSDVHGVIKPNKLFGSRDCTQQADNTRENHDNRHDLAGIYSRCRLCHDRIHEYNKFCVVSSFWAEEFDWKYLNDMAQPEEPESNNGHEEISIEVVCLTLGCWKDDEVLYSEDEKSWKQDETIDGTLRLFPATHKQISAAAVRFIPW